MRSPLLPRFINTEPEAQRGNSPMAEPGIKPRPHSLTNSFITISLFTHSSPSRCQGYTYELISVMGKMLRENRRGRNTMTAGRGVCVKRAVGGRWQAVNVSQTKHFVKNKQCLLGGGEHWERSMCEGGGQGRPVEKSWWRPPAGWGCGPQRGLGGSLYRWWLMRPVWRGWGKAAWDRTLNYKGQVPKEGPTREMESSQK